MARFWRRLNLPILPAEAWKHIFHFMPRRDLLQVGTLSKRMHRLGKFAHFPNCDIETDNFSLGSSAGSDARDDWRFITSASPRTTVPLN